MRNQVIAMYRMESESTPSGTRVTLWKDGVPWQTCLLYGAAAYDYLKGVMLFGTNGWGA